MQGTPTPWYLHTLAIALYAVSATFIAWAARRMIGYYRSRIVSVGLPRYSVTLTKIDRHGSDNGLVLLLVTSGLHITTRQPNGFRRASAKITVAGNSTLMLQGNEICYQYGQVISSIGYLTTSKVHWSLWEFDGLPLKNAKVILWIYVNDRRKTLKGRVEQVTLEYIDHDGQIPGFKKVV
jgi:hypothetical protein